VQDAELILAPSMVITTRKRVGQNSIGSLSHEKAYGMRSRKPSAYVIIHRFMFWPIRVGYLRSIMERCQRVN